MPCTSAIFERVTLRKENQISNEKYTLNLKYLGTQSNVCVYLITGSPDIIPGGSIKSGELYLNQTTNQITLSYIFDSAIRNDFEVYFILTKNGKNSWSGSQTEVHNPPEGECGAITKFSFVK